MCSGFVVLIVESPFSVDHIWLPPCLFGFLCVNCSVLILGGCHQTVAIFSGFSVLIVVSSSSEGVIKRSPFFFRFLSVNCSVLILGGCHQTVAIFFRFLCVNCSVLVLGGCHLTVLLHSSVPRYPSSCSIVSVLIIVSFSWEDAIWRFHYMHLCPLVSQAVLLCRKTRRDFWSRYENVSAVLHAVWWHHDT